MSPWAWWLPVGSHRALSQAPTITMAGGRPQLKRSFSIIPCFVFVEVRSPIPPSDSPWEEGVPVCLSPLCLTSVSLILARSLPGPIFLSLAPVLPSLSLISLSLSLWSGNAVPFLLTLHSEVTLPRFQSCSVHPYCGTLGTSHILLSLSYLFCQMGILRVPFLGLL